MRKLHTWVAVIGIVVAAGAAWWWQHRAATAPAATSADAGAGGTRSPGPGNAAAGGPVVVEVGKAQAVTLEDDAQAVGSVRSRQGVMLRPEVSGRVAKLNFSDGRPVRRGQLLVQLDDTLQQAQLKQAQAQASIARTNLQRSRELVAQNFVSQSAVDQNAAALEVAEAQVALAQAQVGRMRIVAPFDGVAGISNVNLGDYVKDGADLVSIEDLSEVWVDFRLPERYIARVKTGQPVEVSLDAIAGARFQASVQALDAVVDANGRSLLVRARLDNASGALKSGLFARTRIVFSRRENAIMVPEEALVPQGGKQYLVKVIEGPNGSKVSQRLEARLGARQAGRAQILEGVAAGDLVVTAGQARLLRADGLPVRIVEVGRAAPAPAASGAASGARGDGKATQGNARNGAAV